MNPRIRRLQADYQQILAEFSGHSRIRILQTQGEPPERYLVEYRVRSLAPDGEKGFRQADVHKAELFLPMDYPRRAPFCRMLSPVFHPNIAASKICIGDHWSAGQRIGHLIVRIGEMLAYQSYNSKSPLNGEAAAWAELNQQLLPLDKVDLSTGLG